MNILFVIPKDDGEHSPLSQFAQCRVLPPIGLARMAGIAGRMASVRVLDERLKDILLVQPADIVVMFINHYNQHRAYRLAAEYRALGCVVVLTGPMLTHDVEEARNFADCLFIGSGEFNLSEFLWDYRFGRLKSEYNEHGNHEDHTKTRRPAMPRLRLA